METRIDIKRQNLLMNHQRQRLGLEIHNSKIVPNLDRTILERISEENEWEQEYYIIYNSYVLEEKDF